MQVEDGWWPDNPIVPCAGESANGNRLQMLPADSGVEGALGKRGNSIGSGLWTVSYTFKLVVDILDGKEVPNTNLVPWGLEVTHENVKLCETGTATEFAAGCNTISPGVVPDIYAIDFWSPRTSELGFNAALLGEPDY